MSQMMLVVFSSMWFLYSPKNQNYFVSSPCAALITDNDNSWYFIENIFLAKWK